MNSGPHPRRFSLRFVFGLLTAACIWFAALRFAPTPAIVVTEIAGCLTFAVGLGTRRMGVAAIGAFAMLAGLFILPLLVYRSPG